MRRRALVDLLGRDVYGLLDEPSLNFYAVQLYRYLRDAEVEDEGDTKERCLGR